MRTQNIQFCLQIPVTCGSVIETLSKARHFSETCSLSKLDNVDNAAIFQDVLNVLTSQHRKRSNSARSPQCSNLTPSKQSNSARIPHCSKLTTWKTKQFWEAFFKMETWGQSWRPRANEFCDFPLKYCACHEKVMPAHTKCSTCHAKSS